MLGEHKLSLPSTRLKFNHLCIWYLCFESVRGDLQEAHVYDKRRCGYASRCQSLSFRAQNRGFCAFLPSETPVIWHFKHKIGIFVRFCLPEPPFSGFSSTKSRFLCAFALRDPHFGAIRAQNRGFCALLRSETPVFGLFEHKEPKFVLGLPLSAASGRVIAAIFEILHGSGWGRVA